MYPWVLCLTISLAWLRILLLTFLTAVSWLIPTLALLRLLERVARLLWGRLLSLLLLLLSLKLLQLSLKVLESRQVNFAFNHSLRAEDMNVRWSAWHSHTPGLYNGSLQHNWLSKS